MWSLSAFWFISVSLLFTGNAVLFVPMAKLPLGAHYRFIRLNLVLLFALDSCVQFWLCCLWQDKYLGNIKSRSNLQLMKRSFPICCCYFIFHWFVPGFNMVLHHL